MTTFELIQDLTITRAYTQYFFKKGSKFTMAYSTNEFIAGHSGDNKVFKFPRHATKEQQ